MEGFGLAVMVARIGGLRTLLSRGSLDDLVLSTKCARMLALADGPKAWAEAAVALLVMPKSDRAVIHVALTASRMDRALAAFVDLQKGP